MSTGQDKPVDRRKFFRLGLSQALRPLASASNPLQRVVEQLARLEPQVAPPPGVAPEVWLRPPGALTDQKFRETCSGSGKCVAACPVHCIVIDPTGRRGNGAPFIDADAAACVVCQGLQCMSVCPSGALVPTALENIDMGTAVWHERTCLRSAGQNCTICIDHCPLGTAAIELKDGQVAVNPLGCVGCGVCQRDCPTTPKSIVVIPIAAKTAGRE